METNWDPKIWIAQQASRTDVAMWVYWEPYECSGDIVLMDIEGRDVYDNPVPRTGFSLYGEYITQFNQQLRAEATYLGRRV